MNEAELAAEKSAVRSLLGDTGYFVEVGAHHPTSNLSQTWHLEQIGWTGILVEPNGEFVELARHLRPHSKTVQAACTSPDKVGTLTLRIPVHQGVPHSEQAGTEIGIDEPIASAYVTTEVPAITLNEVLSIHASERPDFVSIDVEGTELDVLKGFDLAKWGPRLLLIEDKWVYLDKHRYLTKHGYRLFKRTGPNAWYVPSGGTNHARGIEILRLYWKLYLSIWPRKLRKAMRMRSSRPLTRL